MHPLRPHRPRLAHTPGWLLLTTLVALSARAQDTDQTQPSPTDPSPSTEKVSGKLHLSSVLGSVAVGGRVSARETLGAKGDEAWEGRLTIPNARLEFDYRYKKGLRAVVEFDVTDGLKDAFVWLKVGKGLSVRAGRFKVPVSLVESEATARLPLVRRGLLREVYNSALEISGRRIGAQLEWKCAGCTLDLKVRAGVWQNDDQKAALSAGLGLVPMVRGEWQVLESLELGAGARAQVFSATSDSRWSNWTAELDAKHTLSFGWGEWRTWAEVALGRSDLLVGAQGRMLTARAVTALRFGGTRAGALYLEPFGMLSALDPDLKRTDDRLWEAVGGLNVGQWNRWRLQVQFEHRQAQGSAPTTLKTLDNDLVTRKALLLQTQVVF